MDTMKAKRLAVAPSLMESAVYKLKSSGAIVVTTRVLRGVAEIDYIPADQVDPETASAARTVANYIANIEAENQ